MRVKRLFDLLFASSGVLLFSPLLLLIALLIKLEDGGPVFFSQRRLGSGLRPFTIYKFRSMRNDKVTRVGRWIRATGLDEALQFFNVLKGEMSMVGPRPLTEYDIRRLGWFGSDNARFALKPGITGLSQLYAGRGLRVSAFLDQIYIERASLLLDMRIIFFSFLINLMGKRRVKAMLARHRAGLCGRQRRRSVRGGQKRQVTQGALRMPRDTSWMVALLTLLLFFFILWVIFMADTGQPLIFFDLVRTLPYGDKIGHLALFGTLTLGANIGSALRTVRIGPLHVYIGTLGVLLFAVAEEASQYYFPTRTLDGMDLLADVIGIGGATLISCYARVRRKSHCREERAETNRTQDMLRRCRQCRQRSRW